jgi:PAS domain S-box-containing protein
MKITERLKLNTWISLGAVVFMIFTIAWSFWEIYRADRNMRLINEMHKVTFERMSLRDNYLLNPSEQARIQWYAKSETLRALLKSASERFTGTEDRVSLQEARKNFDTTFSSFSVILEKRRQEESAERRKLAFREAESTLISQVLLNAYALNDNIDRLHDSYSTAAIRAQQRAGIFIVLFVLGTVIAMVINSIFVRKIIAKRISALHEGVGIIGAGNLDYRIDAVGDDELSDLARESNEMVAKLKAYSEYAESIINTVREPLIVLDQDLRVVKVSRSFYEFFNVKPEETMGQLIYDLGNKQWDIPKLRELLETILPEKATFDNYEVEHDFAGVGRRTMLLNARQIQRVLGKERIILLAIEDITERKQAESDKEKLEVQNQQLQKSESLGRMAGAIAHHFNNQLGVVIGNLEMAIDDLPEGAGPVNNLTAAMLAAGKAAEMSGMMLTYLGQTPGKHEPLDLSEVCLRSLPILRAVMPGKVLLEADFTPPGPVVSANANQIQQVLTNLLTNAGEAVGEYGGSIHLGVKAVFPAEIPAAHRFPLDWQPQDPVYACLKVTDDGCGIADTDIENLFDPFFTSKFTGRGMGLAVVLGIVRAHGGAVTVESEPGRGSIFQVFFPVSAEEIIRQPGNGNCGDTLPQGVVDCQITLARKGGGTVLLVEDEEMVREMAAAMLTRLGFTVLEAKDGVEAVEIFRQRRDEIRCVLSDLTMPRMNGWETLTALRKLAPDIPVILASGYDKARVMAGDHSELPQVFLGKPYRFKGLGEAIGQALINKK